MSIGKTGPMAVRCFRKISGKAFSDIAGLDLPAKVRMLRRYRTEKLSRNFARANMFKEYSF
ncbi:hypothetical protein AAE02nite_09320 [Adhaeribacter aerolatus]|uniref:Uncharacterized protein n=1 Tax=Adhaeribacter aerolatus TaxID=670289 RepID=A0A512AU87_9BACT|nr:hypothetical protein AAE02nite_09320 [Adhaeribacter aerolatus]